MKVLVIGTHPDDIEFGMGATIAKHIQLGDEVFIVVLTDGERDENGKYIISYKRKMESMKALKILGSKRDIQFLSFLEVKVQQSTIMLIENIINYIKPDRIYTHSNKDRHQDHRFCYDIILSAGRYVNEILLFEVYSTFPNFNAKYIINISKELLELKIEAIKCFKSQFNDMNLIIEMVKSFAIKNSLTNFARKSDKIYYSEGFEILKMVKDNV